jgi:hypothetical protein
METWTTVKGIPMDLEQAAEDSTTPMYGDRAVAAADSTTPMRRDLASETSMTVKGNPILVVKDSVQPIRGDPDPESEATETLKFFQGNPMDQLEVAETLKVVKGNPMDQLEAVDSAQLIHGGKHPGRKVARLVNGSPIGRPLEVPVGSLETTRGPCRKALGTGPVYGSPMGEELGAPPPSRARGSPAYKDMGRIQ